MKDNFLKKKASVNFWWWLLAIIINLGLVMVLFKYFFTLNQADLITISSWSGQAVSKPSTTEHRWSELKYSATTDYNQVAKLWPELMVSVVKIFEPTELITNQLVKQLGKDLYNLDQPLATAWALTNDGWLVSVYDLADWSELVAIANDSKIYRIDQKMVDPLTDLFFYHLDKANNLSPVKLGESSWSRPGQFLYGVKDADVFQAVWLEKTNKPTGSLVVNSDELQQRWSFSTTINYLAMFKEQGDLFGLINQRGDFIPVNHIRSGLSSLLTSGDFKRVELGLEYINLNQISIDKYGLLVSGVAPNSPADQAGVKVGDILLSIDEVNLNSEIFINDILQNYRRNSRVSLVIQRAGQNYQLNCHFN